MIPALIDRLIEREGTEFVDHPDDRGGPTKYGITIYTLGSWREMLCTAHDVQQLSRMEAEEIYRWMYWEDPRLNTLELSPVLVEMVFDAGVQHGPVDAIKWIQQAVGEKPDGIIGPKTRAAVADQEPPMLAARFIAERCEYYGQLITNNPSQATFAWGWMNRMKEFITAIPAA